VRSEILFRGCEQPAFIAAGQNEVVKRFSDRPIIVDDGYDRCFVQFLRALPCCINSPVYAPSRPVVVPYKGLGFFHLQPKQLGFADQIRYRARLHLAHDIAAMEFYGDLADPKVEGDLLVHQALDDIRHYFVFATC